MAAGQVNRLLRWARGEWKPKAGVADKLQSEDIHFWVCPARAVRIAVDPVGAPWMIDASHAVYRFHHDRWVRIPGRATEISFGPEGSIWAIGSETETDQGWPVLRWDGKSWEHTDGVAMRIAVGPDGLPWLVDARHVIRRLTRTQRWEEFSGRATNIAVGPEGSVWALTAEVDPDGNSPMSYWSGTHWQPTEGAGTRIAVGPDGLPWVVNSRSIIHRLTRHNAWEKLSGQAIDIAVGAEGSVWTISAPDGVNGGCPTFRGRQRSTARVDESAPEYGAAYIDHNIPPNLPGGEVRTCWLTIENRGKKTWLQNDLRVSINLDGACVFQLGLPHSVDPGERVTVHWVLRIPECCGRHEFRIALVESDQTDSLGQRSLLPLHVPFEVMAELPTRTSRLRDLVYENHARCWLPCDGMTWSSSGSGFPQFAREARGYRIIDIEGRQYVDYLMGWGSALLGYADDRIQRAIAEALRSGAILTLTHHLMPEVGEMLCKMFPGAESATFGKNGSDVCTAAVRLARVYTRRPIVLVCGYHGWQDWYVERLGFASTGVPVRNDPLIIMFPFNDLERVTELLEAHRGQVAAVMLEPAGPIEGSSGPIKDADPVFLKEMSTLAHNHGALLIFDEIMTGFRYLRGSVQQATGVVPDLTCLGKALSAGMPLSALIGRKEIFQPSIGNIFYEPTFKGEVYSFAAAREALTIYRERDIPTRLWEFGNRLRTVINKLCERFRIPAGVIGPPYRMLLAFGEIDARRRDLMRTLVHQELLKHGVLTTQNLLLPSAAHDDKALEATRQAFERALEVLAASLEDDRFASRLEIPPLPA